MRIDARDGAAIKDVALVRIAAIEDSELVSSTRHRAGQSHHPIEEKIMSKVLVLYPPFARSAPARVEARRGGEARLLT